LKYVVTSLLLLSPVLAPAADYQIDPAHSAAQFSVRHMLISNVKGEFTKLTGTVSYDPKDVAASHVEAVIDATTISTREPRRDGHLKSPDFFDVAKYPTITFKSKKFALAGGKLQVTGDLTMHGVTKEVVLDLDGPTPEVKDQRGNFHIGASATTKINRKEWGVAYNALLEGGGAVVGDEVTITLDIEAVRTPPKP
jgi:polyisoprenoid-binding protein YceI